MNPAPATPPRGRLLLVDDHAPLRRALGRFLRASGYEVVAVESGEEALVQIEAAPPDLALLDLVLPGMSGMEVLAACREGRDFPIILMSGLSDLDDAARAIELGAYEFLTKPVAPEQLPVVIENALDHDRLRKRERRTRAGFTGLGRVVGNSEPMMQVYDAIRRAAACRVPVLLTGETGTGKNLVAREIHDQSDQRDRPFVYLNCAAVSPALVESEFFGHEKGAFTGATETRRGRFERADGGTLFLDEIDSLSAAQQAKLLHVLETGEFERVGGHETIRVDVRVIAATNAPLKARVREGDFRQDLYYRLAAIPFALPPLRERDGDLALLIRRFLADACDRLDRPALELGPDVLVEARGYDWPGNVRELSNAVIRAVIASGGDVLSTLDWGDDIFLETETEVAADATGDGEGAGPGTRPPGGPRASGGGPPPAGHPALALERVLALPLPDAVTEFQRFYLNCLLVKTQGNRTAATAAAGVDRRTFQRYLKRLGITGRG